MGGEWSPLRTFSTLPAKAESLSLLITADVGAGGLPPSAVDDAKRGRFDMHLHVGDMAYDFPLDHGAVGDTWAREQSEIASRIPFQAWPGNHETDDNHCDFLNYRARFYNQNLTADASRVPSANSRYYSFEVPGLLHVVGIDTDAYAEPDTDTDGNGNSGQSFFVREQWEWLQRDLASVNRTHTPWIFLMGHHPMYAPPPPSQQLPWRATKPSPLPLLRVMSAWRGPAGCPSPPSPPSPSCDRRYCSSRGEARTLTGKETSEPRDPQRDYGPRQSLVEFESPFGARVDPLPRLTCRSTPQKDAGVVPSWWHERHAAWLRRERGGDDARGLAPTGYCYDCSVGAEMIRDGCASNSTPYYPPGVTCGVGKY